MQMLGITPPPHESAPARSVGIDLIKGLSMLYIVGYWHLFNYTDAFPRYYNPLTARVTVVVLALFTLVSGYLLGRKNVALKVSQILEFYKARLIRIYPPFAISLACFFLIGLVPAKVLLPSLALFAMFEGPPPSTLWFVTMIVCFYLAAPFLIHARHRGAWAFTFLSTAILLLFALAHWFSGASDIRMAMYFPSFALGIYIADKNISELRRGLPLLLALTAVSGLLGRLEPQSLESSYYSAPLAICGSFAAFLLAAPIKFKRGALTSILTQLSFASYFMYLTHRVIYHYLHEWFQPEIHLLQPIYLAGIGIPSIVIASWLLQRQYERLINHLLQRTQNHNFKAGGKPL